VPVVSVAKGVFVPDDGPHAVKGAPIVTSTRCKARLLPTAGEGNRRLMARSEASEDVDCSVAPVCGLVDGQAIHVAANIGTAGLAGVGFGMVG